MRCSSSARGCSPPESPIPIPGILPNLDTLIEHYLTHNTLRDLLDFPVEQREWLTFQESLDLTRVSMCTLQSWREPGLLPNTLKCFRTRGLYLRSDLERVLRAPAYNNRGQSHAAVLEAISAGT